jgi:hypothetical protein
MGYTCKGKIKLLDLNFIDRWENRFCWTPRWNEIWLLFLEAMRTELSNHPDGAWAQVFRDLAGIAIMRAKEGNQLPKYPELVEELMDMAYLGAYLEDRYPDRKVLKKVRLGPAEWSFKKLETALES